MRTTPIPALALAVLFPATALFSAAPPVAPAPRPLDGTWAPYASDPGHPWNQLHRTLFVRDLPDGGRRVHATDPLLYRGGTFLLEGEPHRNALAALDRFLAGPGDRPIDDPLKRLFLQRDLWAAFDYAAWYPDDWVFKSKHEPAAVALRSRLAKAIGRLLLNDRELAALPDNYAAAVKSEQFAADHDPKNPDRAFLPADLFDPAGPWVHFHEVTAEPMTPRHFDEVAGRAAHLVFLRLPGGRKATEQYLNELRRGEPIAKDRLAPTLKQFPQGTMVAMVRRALAVDASAKVCPTPVTELVQIRVYRRIPENPRANMVKGDFGEQDVYEFVLDRARLYAGEHGLRPVGRDEPAEPPFARREGEEPFVPGRQLNPLFTRMPQLKTCTQCHQSPGVHSVLSTRRGLRRSEPGATFSPYTLDVGMKYTMHAKTQRFDWGLLQGKLEDR